MTRLLRSLAALLCAALAVPSAEAASVGPFTSFFALGDSTSDPGNLFAATGEPPSPPYFAGRFSSGPVWAEYVAADFAAAARPSANLAFGGARAIGNADGIPDLADQIGLLAGGPAAVAGPRPLVSLWFGANDLVFEGVPTGRAVQVGRAAARAVGGGARDLAALGVGDFVIFKTPNLAGVPLYALSPDAAARRQADRGSRAFNRTLEREIAGLRRDGARVIEIDLETLFAELLADPGRFGVSNVTLPCLLPGQPACGPDEVDARAFFDPLHPNGVIHRAIADEVRAEIAAIPAPLPLLLLGTGVAALLVIGRRAGA